MLPRFEILARRRPVALVSRSSVLVDRVWDRGAPDRSRQATPQPAPYAAVELEVGDQQPGRTTLVLEGGAASLQGWYDADSGQAGLEVTTADRTSTHRSRRHGRVAPGEVEALGLTLTGTHLSVLTRTGDVWTVRGRVDLSDRFDTRDPAWLATLASGHDRSSGPGGSLRIRAGGFGQLGLRDLRVVSRPDGSAYRPDGRLLLTATSAGPGFFDTAHTSVWALDPATTALEHLSDLFFHRPDRAGVFGDHATHLVRLPDEGAGDTGGAGRWLVATSTWGDFDRRHPGATVGVTLAETSADLLSGRRVLETRPLVLPTTGLRSVGVWDPHLIRDGDSWLVGYVSAPKFFRFHPVLASGPTLDSLTLRAAATDRLATEGTTLVRLDGHWRVLASDGRDGRRGQRRRYPVLDLDLAEIGSLDAPYPTNIPWPTVVRDGAGWLLVGFNGAGYGGPLPGYGTHGEVVLARSVTP